MMDNKFCLLVVISVDDARHKEVLAVVDGYKGVRGQLA
ncbi:hypothetical protein BTN49_0838 [Candidatus Enterovibrio escicola]|uniref:Uncharacterized protein n=1 Tax=Candidatus Enterovibrio escicola TaxID=1927127 RepID=A0A2A5T6U0_9GAMM|nr:hypothetical protein BTN49_0838 [Candidatus Enterovibrio escacola]